MTRLRTEGRYVHRQAEYSIVVDGRDISRELRPRLISLSLSEKRGSHADELELVLDDSDGKLAIPPAGAQIAVRLGWRDLGPAAAAQLIDKGLFKVDRRRHTGAPDRISVTAHSADLTRAFRQRRTTSWTRTTLGDVLGEIAGRNGWQPHISPDKAGIDLQHLDQARESDAAFLNRLGRLYDAVATVKAGRLIFAQIGAGVTASGVEIPSAAITRRSGDQHTWEAAERDAYTGVIAEWQNRVAAKREQVVVGSDENAKKLARVYASGKSARTAADTEWKKIQRGAAEFSLSLAVGRPDLFPERTLTVSGFKPEIDNAAWLISELRHTLDANGLRTQLQMELGGKPE